MKKKKINFKARIYKNIESLLFLEHVLLTVVDLQGSSLLRLYIWRTIM